MVDHAIVWFRRDLRVASNPAWAAATSEQPRVTALFVVDPVLLAASGEVRVRQLFAELDQLDALMRERGGRLRIQHGDPRLVVPSVADELRASRVYWNADVTPYAVARDEAVRRALAVEPSTHWGGLVLAPGSVRTTAGVVPRVFGAFHRAWSRTEWSDWPSAGDAEVADDAGESLGDLSLSPATDGGAALRPAGEDAAHAALAKFLDGPIRSYVEQRDRIDLDATSELSVALKFGTISPRDIIAHIDVTTDHGAAFVRQLAWRDWFAHLMFENPHLVERAMRPEFDRIEWRDDPPALEAWKQGRTGVPIVDAGMRQLAQTGAMHNRVRMITASFLTKDLLIDWRLGERHFRRLLLDGDVPQNVGNWQWVAGTGPDAAPFFRIFNPVRQSRAHDPTGAYIRRWVPELAALDDTTIHEPGRAGPLDLAAAGVVLGDAYPEPIVDHEHARVRALAAYQAARTAGR